MTMTSCRDLGTSRIQSLLITFGLRLVIHPRDAPIPGSYWGVPEAGLIGRSLNIREDTPVHSALHEACHFVCMDEGRRSILHTDAGGSIMEENAVCYLQVILADHLVGFDRKQMLADMDAWGYGFRLGSATAWFERDAEDAREWLRSHGLIDEREQPTWRVRS